MATPLGFGSPATHATRVCQLRLLPFGRSLSLFTYTPWRPDRSAILRLYETDPDLTHAIIDVGPRLADILTALLTGYLTAGGTSALTHPA